MTDIDETGAIDWFLIEFTGKELNGELIPPLLDLVDRRLIRVLDALIIKKRVGDDFDTISSNELSPEEVGDLGALAGTSCGRLADEDARRRGGRSR